MVVRRLCLLLLVGLLAACSLRGAMNAMVSEEDRAFAQAMVDNLKANNSVWLERHFEPALWEESAKELANVPALYPTAPGPTEIVSYSVNSSNVGSPTTERRQEFTLVTEGGGRWAVTHFRTFASGGGPARVTQWSVTPHTTEPAELAFLRGVDNALPWFWGAALVVLLIVIGIVVVIVRKNRSRRDSLMGQRGGHGP